MSYAGGDDNQTKRLVFLFKEAENEILNDTEKYKEFLKFQSRLYKYPYQEQVLLFNYNPNARAYGLATDWKKIGREIKDGEKPEIVLSDKGIKYLFEYEQTQGYEFKITQKDNINKSLNNNIIDSFNINSYLKSNTIPTDNFEKKLKTCMDYFIEENLSKEFKTLLSKSTSVEE